MVLLKKNQGKLLDSEYQADRCRALEDRLSFTAAELTFLNIGATDGQGRTDPDNYELDKSNLTFEPDKAPDPAKVRFDQQPDKMELK